MRYVLRNGGAERTASCADLKKRVDQDPSQTNDQCAEPSEKEATAPWAQNSQCVATMPSNQKQRAIWLTLEKIEQDCPADDRHACKNAEHECASESEEQNLCNDVDYLHGGSASNENKMSDGGRGRVSLGVEV
jgi:hypothetical protein